MAIPILGVWFAYNHDGSAVIPFASELDALRYGNVNMMPVKWVAYGHDVISFDKAKWRNGELDDGPNPPCRCGEINWLGKYTVEEDCPLHGELEPGTTNDIQ